MQHPAQRHAVEGLAAFKPRLPLLAVILDQLGQGHGQAAKEADGIAHVAALPFSLPGEPGLHVALEGAVVGFAAGQQRQL